MVGITLQQVALDALEAASGDLRPAGVVEEDVRAAEGRKLAADRGRVKGHVGLLNGI